MAFLEALKELGKIVAEGIKEHPVAAAAVGVTAVAAVGGVGYLSHRKGKKQAAAAMQQLGFDPKNPAQPQAVPAEAAAPAPAAAPAAQQ
ncbi:hypothetical protein D3C76_376160 [compost metagenome]